MALPLLFSFLAPQLLGGTALGTALGTAGMSALGAGLGGWAETGDLEKGIMTGLGSFAGGQLLGGLGGEAGSATGDAAGASLAPTTSPMPMAPPASIRPDLAAAAPTGIAALKGGVSDLMSYAASPQGIGTMVGGAMGQSLVGNDTEEPKRSTDADTEAMAIPRMATMPGADYNPGTSGEWDYGISTPYSAGQIMDYTRRGIRPYANGGMLQRMATPNLPGMGPVRLAGGGIVALADGGDVPQQPNEREIISAAVSAVRGTSPQPEVALAMFVRKFGEQALRQLVDAVQSGKMQNTSDRFAKGENGAVQGPGDGSGVDDMVPAKMDDGSGDVLLSDGEYVLRKDAADSLEQKFGGGFLDEVNQSGANAGDTAQRMASA